MTQEWKTKFFEALSGKLEEYTNDNLLQQNEATGEWFLKTAFATSPEKEEFVPVQAVTYPARADVLLLELYVMLTPEVPEAAVPEVQKAVDELNAYLPVGCLGIYPTDGHLYLRDCFRLDTGLGAEECARDALTDYELILEVMVAAYPGLKEIWSGNKTFEQTVEENLLKRHSR